MLTTDQIKALDRVSNKDKLLPSTINFMRAMREEFNAGRARRGEALIPWTDDDELRYGGDERTIAQKIADLEANG